MNQQQTIQTEPNHPKSPQNHQTHQTFPTLKTEANENHGLVAKPSPPKAQKEELAISFWSLLRYSTWKDIIYMIIGTIGSALDGTTMPLFAIFFGSVPDDFISGDGEKIVHAAAKLGLNFLYLGIGSFITAYLGFVCWMIVGETQGIEIRKRYFKSLLQQDIAFYDSINPNELSTKISEECFNIQQGIGEKVPTFCYSVAMLFSGLIIGYIKGWQLALVLTGFMPVMVITGAIFVLSNQKLTKINNECYSRAGAISEEVLSGIRTVVSLGGQERETERYKKVLEENKNPILKYSVVAGCSVGLILFSMFAIYALGFFVGSKFIQHQVYNPTNDGPYKVGDVLTVFFAIMMASFTPARATPSIKAFAIAKANGAKAFKIIDRKSKISINDPKGLKPTECKGIINFRDVIFAYPSKQERIILNGVSFDIRPNEKTALVGESGCGKTTCMQLIERFYDIETCNGSITLDGNELKDLNLKWMRENIGYVGQEPVLFATSIKENLMMAKEDATEAELWDALKKANAAEFVQGLPDKLNTFVGNSGTALSGGQKQRLAIARAILKNPTVLLLDEATSALDRKNEMEIQKTLDEISKGRTTIVIAHRLSTIINADHIIVFDQGKIVEEGRHDELIEQKGRYYALQHLQLQAEEKDKKNKNTEEDDDVVEPTLTPNKSLKNSPSKTDKRASSSNNEMTIKVDDGNQKEKDANTSISQTKKYKDSDVFSRLFVYSKRDIPITVLGCFCAIIHGMLFPLIAPVLANILFVLGNPSRPDFGSKTGLYSGLFLLLAFVAFLSLSVQMSLFNLVAERLSRKVRADVFRKYVRMPIGWFDEPLNAPGALGSKLSTDATLLNTLTSSVFGVYMQAASGFISGVVIAFIGDWRVALVGLACCPLQILSGKIRAKFNQQMTASSDDAYQESIAFASEAVNNMRTVASFGKEYKLLENYSLKLAGPLRASIINAHKSGLAFAAGQFINFGINGLVFYVSALFMRSYGLGFKDMFMAVMGIMMACMATGNALQFAPDVGSAKNSAMNIFRILDVKPAIDIDDPNQNVRDPIKGDIEFRNVWFKYPSREKQIFKGLNLKINSSTKVAFVGPSGCGKSTILALLQRFYDVDQGEILIDGVNIKNYDLKHLRETYGVVSQEPVLFNGTIEYNIKYAKENASDEEMRTAAERANAIGFIESNEFDVIGDEKEAAAKYGTGFHRKVGPKGSQLSGGQKQRIAIARAILKNPSILILDEATSALDAQNEKTVQEALDKIMAGKTSVIVAHRISTIKDSDEILVFNDGEIVERGNYQQLNDMKGIFYKLERGMNLTDPVVS